MAAARGDWQTAASLYALCADQRAAELELINSVQSGLAGRQDMHAIYDLVGDILRATFNAQVVMISEYDPATRTIFHHYANELGEHLHIQGWHPIDVSRAKVIRTRKPVMINEAYILKLLDTGKMRVIPGTQIPRTWMGVPMMVGNQARGIVSLQNLDKENAFTLSDIALLTALTNSLSLSLENARLFNETERFLRTLRAEMEIARQTQRSILPGRLPRHPSFDFGSLITPARAVGGDFYDFIRLDRNRLALVIGDVSDKGLPAALFMALTFSLVRAETERSGGPVEVLSEVNRSMRKMNASGMFVTLVYALLDLRSGALTYARAGHQPPIVMDGRGQPLSIPLGRGQPLGLFEQVKLDLQTVTIPPGGLALLFSDGLNEAADRRGGEFGDERIRQTLRDHRGESAKAICRRLWGAVKAHGEGAPQHDDFTAVIVKRIS